MAKTAAQPKTMESNHKVASVSVSYTHLTLPTTSRV